MSRATDVQGQIFDPTANSAVVIGLTEAQRLTLGRW